MSAVTEMLLGFVWNSHGAASSLCFKWKILFVWMGCGGREEQSSQNPLQGGLSHRAPCSQFFISLLWKGAERGIEKGRKGDWYCNWKEQKGGLKYTFNSASTHFCLLYPAGLPAAGRQWSCAGPCLTWWCTPTPWQPRTLWMMVQGWHWAGMSLVTQERTQCCC